MFPLTYERLDRASFSLVLILAAGIPFFFIPLPYVPLPEAKTMFFALFLALASVAWIAARISEGVVRIPRTPILFALALVPLATALSAIVGSWGKTSLVGTGIEQDTLAATFLGFAVSTLIVFVCNSREKIRTLLQALGIGAAGLIALQLIHFAIPLFPLSAVFAARAGNAIGTWHEYAIALGLFVVLAMPLTLFSEREGVWFRIMLAIGASSFAILVIAGFQDVWASLAVLFSLTLANELYRKKNRIRRFFTKEFRREQILLGLTLFGLACTVWTGSIAQAIPAAFRVDSVEVRPSLQGTFSIALQEIASQPKQAILGMGPNRFFEAWTHYKPLIVNSSQFWNQDYSSGFGTVPTALITIGIVGLLAWFGVCCAIGFVAWRLAPAYDPETLALILGSAYLALFEIMFTPGPGLQIAMWIVVGLLFAKYASVRGRWFVVSVRVIDVKSVAALLGASLFLFFTVIAASASLRIAFAESMVIRGLNVYAGTGKLDEAGRYIDLALATYPSDDGADRAAVALDMQRIQRLAAADTTDRGTQDLIQSAITDGVVHALHALSVNDHDYRNWLQTAVFYQALAQGGVSGASDQAKRAYQGAIRENPTSPVPLFGLAQIEVLAGNKEEALQDVQRALALKQDFSPAYELSVQLQQGSGAK